MKMRAITILGVLLMSMGLAGAPIVTAAEKAVGTAVDLKGLTMTFRDGSTLKADAVSKNAQAKTITLSGNVEFTGSGERKLIVRTENIVATPVKIDGKEKTQLVTKGKTTIIVEGYVLTANDVQVLAGTLRFPTF